MNKAIFLDRDGVINENTHYVNCIEDFHILPKVKEALILFKQAGYKIFVVTNQGGIEKGFITREDVEEIHDYMIKELPEIMDFDYCPSYNSFGRKPNPGMLYKLALNNEVFLGHSWMIGDMATDVIAGIRAGCKTGLIVNKIEESIKVSGKVNIYADSLYDAAIQILTLEGFLL